MQAIAWLASGLAALALAGCSNKGNEVADMAAQFGCGQIDGLKQLTQSTTPIYILVGETIETKEAPAAFAELACQLAARQVSEMPLWVGLPEYVGGSNDAQNTMRVRLYDLIAKGAPIVIGSTVEGHPTNSRDRSRAEKFWADTITANLKSVGAGRALLLLSRNEATAEPFKATGERFAGYDPLAMHFPEGQAISLEIGTTPTIGLDAPAVRIYPAMTNGFMGQIALGSLTPATFSDAAYASSEAPLRLDAFYAGVGLNQVEIHYVANSGLDRDQQLSVLARYLEREMSVNRRAMIEKRRVYVSNGYPDDIAGDNSTQAAESAFPALARAKAMEELAAYEKRQAEGVPLPFAAPSPIRVAMPRYLVELVENNAQYAPADPGR